MSGSPSTFEETEMERDIRIEDDQRELYDALVEEEDSPFYDMRRKDLFMFAVGYGRRKGGRKELSGAGHALFNRSSLSDTQEWIIKAVAVKEEESADVLRDEKYVYEVAREYAKAGIEELHKKSLGPSNAFNDLLRDVTDLQWEDWNESY